MRQKRFFEYAEAFERAYASGDWSVLEEYFTEDATPLWGVNNVH